MPGLCGLLSGIGWGSVDDEAALMELGYESRWVCSSFSAVPFSRGIVPEGMMFSGTCDQTGWRPKNKMCLGYRGENRQTAAAKSLEAENIVAKFREKYQADNGQVEGEEGE